MYRILLALAEDVDYIKINPRHNDRFVKVIAEAGKIVRIKNVEYSISDIESRSPELIELIMQEEIIINKIMDKWKFEKERNLSKKC